MKPKHLAYLVCPHCLSDLKISATTNSLEGEILAGDLTCTKCPQQYPIVAGVPRFVPHDNYASGFGLEWTVHARTQYDSYSGIRASEARFFGQTHWPARLDGEIILEAGSGSGRFTEQAANTGAMVISFDYSFAVEANFRSNGHRANVCIVQADVFSMPFRRARFDRVFCFGMLQHTPNPEGALKALAEMPRSGGCLAVDIYKASVLRVIFGTKYYIRPFTSRMAPERLYCLVKRWVDLMWPLAARIRRLPKGYAINWRLLVADYSFLGLTGEMLKEWAYLDTFDMLSPRYDRPVRVRTFRRWLERAGLREISTEFTPHGLVARAVK